MDNSDNLERAVLVALDPSADPQLKYQATTFCDQIKNSPEGWQLCLSLFIKVPQSAPEVRFFALQVLEDWLRNRYGVFDGQQKTILRQTLWEWLARDLNNSEPVFIRNMFAHILVLLLKNEYPHNWPTFFDDLLALLSASSPSVPRGTSMVDMFLRISKAIDDEIVCLYIARSAEEGVRNTAIKDAMRENAINKLTDAWFNILQTHWNTDVEIASACLHVIGLYVSWIDIKLVATSEFMSGLFQFLTMESMRIPACSCLSEIVSKGMKAEEKVNLIRALNISTVLDQLSLEDEDFREHIAKLINVMGLELCQCWDDLSRAGTGVAAENTRNAVYMSINSIFPYLVKFLADEYDDTSSAMFPFLGAYLMLLKRQVKESGGKLSESLQPNVMALLRVVIMKMKCDEEEQAGFGEEAGEDEALFSEMRKNLKVHFDALFAIEPNLAASYVSSVVCSTFNAVRPGMSQTGWSDAELALHLLFIYGEAVKGVPQYSVVSPGGETVLTPLGEMLLKMIESYVSMYPHVSIQPLFFENICRYWQFLEQNVNLIPTVLQAFTDARGLHHPRTFVRSRINYLFLRFVKAIKLKLDGYVEMILASVQDLLVVQELSQQQLELEKQKSSKPGGLAGAGASEPIPKTKAATHFDSQLYLFEAVGVLISLEPIDKMKQVELLNIVVMPILSSCQKIIQEELYKQDVPPDVVPVTTHLSHLILSIGGVSKGFPDYEHASKSAVPPWSGVFQQSLEAIVVVLERLNGSALIRDAARYTFQRMVNCVGPDILPYIRPLITAGLLSAITPNELVDFIPFISFIIHKFKPSISVVLNGLLSPLFERIFFLLNQPVSGTDDAIMLTELRKAYLNLLATIFNADVENFLTNDINVPHLQTILQTILVYMVDASDAASQKLAFSVLSKMIVSWGGGTGVAPGTGVINSSGSHGGKSKSASSSASSSNSSLSSLSTPTSATPKQNGLPASAGNTPTSTETPPVMKQPLPGFDSFIYEGVVPLLFDVPKKTGYSPQDGQAVLVLNEIAAVHRTLFATQGEKYIDYLRRVYLPSSGYPLSADEFVEALRRLDQKQFRNYLRTIAPALKAHYQQ
ncbi:pre-tRNA nuclear export protein [Quaeritorhiza haematococci]|nr:pre-tRNA nuclear export protein [Quaeritorhiza haematococci]